jgi:hypothetical protein
MSADRLDHFMSGFVAACQLLQRAGNNGFFVEYVCLAASVIDAALRVGLVLQHQLRTGTTEVPAELVFQSTSDRIISERQIYRRALDEGVIDEALFRRLETLYEKRNRVVHRYIISDLTTRQVLEIGCEFEQTIPLVNAAVGRLEARQVEVGVGMTQDDEFPGLGRALGLMSAAKHGDDKLAEALKGTVCNRKDR